MLYTKFCIFFLWQKVDCAKNEEQLMFGVIKLSNDKRDWCGRKRALKNFSKRNTTVTTTKKLTIKNNNNYDLICIVLNNVRSLSD